MLHLIVHRNSHSYIRGIVAWLTRKVEQANRARFQDKFDAAKICQPSLSVVDAIDDAQSRPGQVNLIIGDPFGPFRRRQGQTYVFINFSLLYELAPQRLLDKAAAGWIARKHDRMMEKVHFFDLVVDFLPEQTPLLRHELAAQGVPVAPLLVSTEQDPDFETAHDKQWDVCVVGSATPRRKALLTQFASAGLSLSPQKTENLALTVSKSRVVLNMHAYDCVTCEYPRIVEAMTSGACLLTEPCIGLTNLVSPGSFACAPYEQLTNNATALILDDERRKRLGQRLRADFVENYKPRSDASWDDLVTDWLDPMQASTGRYGT